jgi:hypothetical protein
MLRRSLFVSGLALLLAFGLFAPSLLANPEYKDEHKGAAPVHLASSFEDLLHRQERLLHSFESLVNLYKVPPISLLKSYEDLLRRQALLLSSFEEVIRPYACGMMRPEFKLIKSFEALLHGQAKLLMSFEHLLHKLGNPPIELIESFEDLLRRQTDLLKSFEGLLHCLVDKHNVSPKEMFPFLKSFEDLLRDQTKLLMSFETLVKGTAGYSSKPRHEKDHYEEPAHKEDPYKKDDHKDEYKEPEHKSYDDSDHKDEYSHDRHGDDRHDGKDDHYEERDDHKRDEYGHGGYGLPSLEKLMEFAHKGHQKVKYRMFRELFHERKAMTEHLVAKIEGFKYMIHQLHNKGHYDEAKYKAHELQKFRLGLSALQSKILKGSLKVTIASDDHGYGHKDDDKEYGHHSDYDDDYGYGHYEPVKLIVSNNGPFTVTMASFAVFHGHKVVHRVSLGTLEPGEHKVIKLKVKDKYEAHKLLENSVTTGFLRTFSKLFQAAMMDY